MDGQGAANRVEGRCDLVLLGWTAFIVLNLASDYFWTRGSSEAEDVATVSGSAGMGTADIYMGSYTLESNGSLLEEGTVRMGFGSQPSPLMSVHANSISLSLMPKDLQRGFGPLQSQLLFAGLELGGAGRAIAIGNTDPRTFRHFGARSCVVQAYLDTGFEVAYPEHLGEHPSASRISGEVVGESCGFRLRFVSKVVDREFLSNKVVHYSMWVNLLCVWQIRCFMSQMNEADDGPAVAKVSMLCIAMQALTDAYDSFLHLCLGLSSQVHRVAAHLRCGVEVSTSSTPPTQQGTLSAHCHENEELRDLPAATCALVFLTAHGLVRLSKWLHEEWREGSSRQLRLVTCVESLDSAVDFNEPDALFANANELEWPVCRDLERWGVFVVPPFGQDVSTWSESLPPLQLTRAEAEATQAAALSNVLTEEQVDLLDALGSKLLESEDETTDSIDLFAHSEVSFHKAAEAALHRLGQHRVLYLHSDEATAQLSSDERTFLQTLEETVSARIRSEDASRWGLLGRRAVALRSMEYHAYGDGGSVMDPEHRDDGSLLTVSILLSRKDNFEGGIFSTFVGSQRVELAMGTGDGVLFVSEKRHNVSPVIGDRRTLVLEFWEGMRNHHGRHD